jgi:response regulator of citrate/malate metabolism
MSHSSLSPVADSEAEGAVTERSLSGTAKESALQALQDPDCRSILRATSREALSANEIGEQCELPLSTTYRKLDCLTEADLLAEQTRISSSGKHASEYTKRVESVHVSVDENGDLQVTVAVDRPEEQAAPVP